MPAFQESSEGAQLLLYEPRILKGPADDWHWVQPEPVFDKACVNAAEVEIRDKVSLVQIFGLCLGVLAVHAALDAFADCDANAPGAVVCTGSVVIHATPEL